eukprot:CAMPEP_0183469742 /NCGR_PEP_ID=MMETSP0370-20130417/155044_1 /TAXON_ID=268820 /ORGANISM="Peridinium aciculiferum, Strain PAER-2" /LENGTH=60 /DNA_ID=CAMNT_0025662229 /DNA_START=19 /DNA_END=198 /DNA_ORIENTATION=+
MRALPPSSISMSTVALASSNLLTVGGWPAWAANMRAERPRFSLRLMSALALRSKSKMSTW